MRTLTRPMFNMGGPIKQGIMHGIREPHKDGKIVGGHQSPLLAGAHPWKDKSGREHHVLPAIWAGAAGFARFAPALYRALSAGKNIKNVAGAANISKNVGTTGITAATPGWLKAAITRDPIFKGGKWLKETLMGPTAKTWGKKIAQGVGTPTGLLTAGYIGSQFLPGKKEIDPPTGLMKPGGFPSAAVDIPEVRVKSQAEKDAFAKSQREKRVNKYLDLMGYDRSKKMAIADALIDASKIVGDRGSLDPKNITQELINPIIQATSKRLDKPGQIREAVGLMATKAEIEKDLSKEKDALKTTLTELQIEGARETLKASRSFEGGLKAFLGTRKGGIDKDELEQISRLLADEHNEPFIKTDAETVVSGDGIYMIGDGIFRVTDGVEKQLA